MKKWILFLLFTLAFQFGYKIMPVLAANEGDTLAVKNVINTYLNGMVKGDINSMMNLVSTEYFSFNKQGNAIDYAQFKADTEGYLKRFTKLSITDLKITKLDIEDNKATVEFEFNRKAYDLKLAKEVNDVVKRRASLVKEASVWKIVRYVWLE